MASLSDESIASVLASIPGPDQLALPWQENIWQELLLQIRSKMLAPGLMLIGPTGVGKYYLSLRLGAALLCPSTGIHGTRLSGCTACEMFFSGNHPEFFHLKPEGKSTQIRIEQIRALTQQLAQTSSQAEGKLVIIELAEQMNANSANALLKTLEEPNSDTKFILLSENQALVPATIRSRCVKIQAPSPTLEQLKAFVCKSLPEKANLSDQAWLQWSRMAQGQPLTLLALLEQNMEQLYLDWQHQLIAVLQNQQPTYEALSILDAVTAPQALDWLMLWLKCALSQQLMQQPVDPDPLVQYLASHYSKSNLLTFWRQVIDQKEVITENGNVNTGLMLESLLINLSCSA